MRFATLAGIGLIAVSTAALAQVVGSPVEQKIPAAGTSPGNAAEAPPTVDFANNATAVTADDAAPATPRPEPKPSPSPSQRRR